MENASGLVSDGVQIAFYKTRSIVNICSIDVEPSVQDGRQVRFVFFLLMPL